ncbi:hypothetical protein ACQ9LF_02150 [Anaerohalosphaeraceae bacterium U12dextr]
MNNTQRQPNKQNKPIRPNRPSLANHPFHLTFTMKHLTLTPPPAESAFFPFALYLFPFLPNEPNFPVCGYVGLRHTVRSGGINPDRVRPNEPNSQKAGCRKPGATLQ